MAQSAYGSAAERVGVNSMGLGQALEHSLMARGGAQVVGVDRSSLDSPRIKMVCGEAAAG